eukprot:21802_5
MLHSSASGSQRVKRSTCPRGTRITGHVTSVGSKNMLREHTCSTPVHCCLPVTAAPPPPPSTGDEQPSDAFSPWSPGHVFADRGSGSMRTGYSKMKRQNGHSVMALEVIFIVLEKQRREASAPCRPRQQRLTKGVALHPTGFSITFTFCVLLHVHIR